MATTHLLTIALDDGVDPLIAENLTEFVHQLIPGSHTVDSLDLTDTDLTDFEWDEGDEKPALLLTRQQASDLADDEGRLTVVTAVPQLDYRSAVRDGVRSRGEFDEHHLAHELIFDFGVPDDSELRILAVSGDDLVISYSTTLVDPDEED